MESLWGDEFNIIEKPKSTKKIVDKINNPKVASKTPVARKVSTKLTLSEQLENIAAEVNRVLGVYKDNTQVITNVDDFISFMNVARANKIIAIDTETNNSLEPITCKLMGLCLYTPGLKQAYIPVNHVDKDTKELLPNQITEEQIKEQLMSLDGVEVIMHNGKFDYQVIKCTCGVSLNVTWDTLVGAKVLDENEFSAGLKQQYIEKIDPSIEKYSIEHLFENVEYAVVDPAVFALYAATDSYMTFKLYEWQKKQFEKAGNEKLFNMFKTLEMPIMTVTAEMELSGIHVDKDYCKLLSAKYHKKLDAIEAQLSEELHKYDEVINAWRKTPEANEHPPKQRGSGLGKSKSEQLENPVALTSPTQLAILLYDVLKIKPVSIKTPRGTGEDILLKIDLPICKLILKQRELLKLINTYIDKIPQIVIEKTGKVHTHFHQYGAKTGRFSSSEPINLQNIPSSNKEIRMCFNAAPGKILVGGDFSSQEPRLTSFYANDPNMIQAFVDNKDLYSVIAASMYNNRYEDNLEFYPEGTEIVFEGQKVICGYKTHLNKAGKERRTGAKSVLLGLVYGRGANSIAEQIGKSKEEAQEIIDKFYKNYPKVKQWIDTTISDARVTGYVEDFAGRRRRLPDIQLPKYIVKYTDPAKYERFNPLLETTGRSLVNSDNRIDFFKKKLNSIKDRKDYNLIKKSAADEGIEIHDNTGFIAEAERQAVNCVDADTQILTLQGWKKYNEISIGDKILSFNTESQLIEEDSILDIYAYKENIDAIRIKHSGLNCISTLNHRWPLYSRGTKKVSFETTEYISKYKNYGTKKIIKSADNAFKSTCELSDSELYLLGILFTDGHVYNIPNKYNMSSRYSCSIVQSSAKSHILDKIQRNLHLANISYSKQESKHKAESALPSYTFNIHQPTATRWGKLFPDKRLTYDFINTLSQHQAKVLLEGMIDGDGSYDKHSNGASITTAKFDQVGVIQYLIIRAGYASTYKILDYRGKKCYSDKLTNKENCIEIKNIYYTIHVHSRRYADVLAKNCSSEILDFAWCVRTNNSTWIARSADGYTFITGNSRVQGGAASLTKYAMLAIHRDEELNRLGFKLAVTVHDEVLGECPLENADQVEKRLAEVMIDSAKPYVSVPMKVDTYKVSCWYLDEFSATVESEFKKLIKEQHLEEHAAFEKMCQERTESTRTQLYEILKPFMKYVPSDVDTLYKSIY